MDDLKVDKTSNLSAIVSLSSPDTKVGFRSRPKGRVFLFLILVSLIFSSFQYFKPATAVATIATISAMNFQPAKGLSDEEILSANDASLTIDTDISTPHENDVDTQASAAAAATTQTSLLFDRSHILSDYKSRVSEAFHVPVGLNLRVQFWFDVYTKYGLEERVIHSQKYPWLIFKVVDVAPILYAESPSLQWLRNQKAEKVVHAELSRTKLQLLKIAHTKSLENLSEEEQLLVNVLQALPGKLQKNAQIIAGSLRIQTGQKEVFQEGLSLSRQFLPQMDEIFKSQKLPTELTRIPLVESSFNDLATSKAGASGVWQFIGNTGKKFLMVNSNIDERRSPIKSAAAAALVLKEDYMLLKHEWPLAVTAYNHGPGGVRHAAKVSKSYELATIITKYQSKSFGFATSNYYSEFLAALYAEKYQDEIFGATGPDENSHTQVVRLSRNMHAHELLSKIDMPEDDFIDLNPELRKAVQKNSSLPKGFRLHIPADKKLSDPNIFVKAPSPHGKNVAKNDSTKTINETND